MFATQDIKSSIKRCAVCRIDLKGRFVFVDDGIEKLMGYSREQLFGKQFIEFVDEADKALILSIIRQYSRYETNYESVRIRLINRKNETISANAIIALNFITGNPVNYQIIIDVERTAAYTAAEPTHEDRFQRLVEELLQIQAPVPAAGIEALYNFVGPERAIIYQIMNGNPEPVYSRHSTAGDLIRKTAVPKKLLRWVADSDEDYSFADSNHVRRAIEMAGSAPNEFICPFNLGSGKFLLRLSCPESPDPNTAQHEFDIVRAAMSLVVRLYKTEPAPSPATLVDAAVVKDLQATLASALQMTSLLGSQAVMPS